jgi:hypothetical protein
MGTNGAQNNRRDRLEVSVQWPWQSSQRHYGNRRRFHFIHSMRLQLNCWRYSFGVQPNFLRKQVAKYWLVLNPQVNAISVIVRPAFFKALEAKSRRQIFRYSIGPLLTNSRQYLENVVVPRPQCSAMLVLLHVSEHTLMLCFKSFKNDSSVRRGEVRFGVSGLL